MRPAANPFIPWGCFFAGIRLRGSPCLLVVLSVDSANASRAKLPFIRTSFLHRRLPANLIPKDNRSPFLGGKSQNSRLERKDCEVNVNQCWELFHMLSGRLLRASRAQTRLSSQFRSVVVEVELWALHSADRGHCRYVARVTEGGKFKFITFHWKARVGQFQLLC